MRKFVATVLASAGALALSAPALAGPVFVGSWAPYNPAAPVWNASPNNGPLAYTGQEAAALLFGGAASDYFISTVDSNPLNIDHQAWYDVIGIGGGIYAENYNHKYLGMYYGPTSGYFDLNSRSASAFVRDNGVKGINYAFRNPAGAVPEPATWALMMVGFGLAGAALRRRPAVAVRFAF